MVDSTAHHVSVRFFFPARRCRLRLHLRDAASVQQAGRCGDEGDDCDYAIAGERALEAKLGDRRE